MANGQFQDDTNNSDPNKSVASEQGADPNAYQNLAQPYPYDPQQVAGQQMQQPVVQQQIQPQSVSPSSEVPARVETSENMIMPEVIPEQKSGTEQKKQEVKIEQQEKLVEKASDTTPDQTKFESPFKVYGYRISQKIASLGRKLKNGKVKGDTSSSKTWLIVLLGRLLKVYKGEGLKKAE